MAVLDRLIPLDHLDLLVTAASRYGVLRTVAFGDGPVDPGRAAALLLDEQLAAARWHADRGRAALELPPHLLGYRHRPVGHLDPVEVVKACHAYQHCAAPSPGWPASLASRLVDAVLLEATRRVPGYTAAPWRWTRPSTMSGAPVGLRRSWAPPLPTVRWLESAELVDYWPVASHVVVTLEALLDVPVGLPARPRTYLVSGDQVPTDMWPAISASTASTLVMLPAGLPWLLEELDPAVACESL